MLHNWTVQCEHVRRPFEISLKEGSWRLRRPLPERLAGRRDTPITFNYSVETDHATKAAASLVGVDKLDSTMRPRMAPDAPPTLELTATESASSIAS